MVTFATEDLEIIDPVKLSKKATLPKSFYDLDLLEQAFPDSLFPAGSGKKMEQGSLRFPQVAPGVSPPA